MDYCNNYFKILIIILLISVVFYLSKQIRETFITIGKCDLENQDNCAKVPTAIKVMINTNNTKNIIKLTWRKNKDTDIKQYFILMYKNNAGPYIIKPEVNYDDEEHIYEMLKPDKNVIYKFAVIGENEYGIGKINKFTEVILTLDGLEVNYIKEINSKVICNANGSYKINDKCIENEEVSAKITDNNIENNFNNNLHEHLMEQLNSKKILKFNF